MFSGRFDLIIKIFIKQLDRSSWFLAPDFVEDSSFSKDYKKQNSGSWIILGRRDTSENPEIIETRGSRILI